MTRLVLSFDLTTSFLFISTGSVFGAGARARLADDELYDYGDDYDDEDYGSE